LLLREAKPDEKGTDPKTREVRYEGHLDDVLSVAFFADGLHFVSAGGGDGPAKGKGDYSVRVWRVGEKQPRATFTGHSARVGCVAVSPDGSRILSGDLSGALHLWDAATGLPFPRFDKPKDGDGDRGAVTCVFFNRDGAEAVSGYTDGTLRVWVLPKTRE
jgi:WD40 repeat protein